MGFEFLSQKSGDVFRLEVGNGNAKFGTIFPELDESVPKVGVEPILLAKRLAVEIAQSILQFVDVNLQAETGNSMPAGAQTAIVGFAELPDSRKSLHFRVSFFLYWSSSFVLARR